MSQKYDPETFVSQKHKNMLVRKIEINDKNTDFQRQILQIKGRHIQFKNGRGKGREKGEKDTGMCSSVAGGI